MAGNQGSSPAPPTLLLIDGNGLAYRAFYAMPPLRTSQGRPVNAVYGFTNMLVRLLEQEAPDFVVAAFDKSAPTERLAAYQDYKAHRESMPEDLSAQFPLIEEVVEEYGIPIVSVDGHEADDAIATLARKAEADGIAVTIVTGDRDLLQLARPGVKVLLTKKGITDLALYDDAAVRAQYGFAPPLIPDFKALAGDASDHIPGVPGIGSTGAAKLVAAYGTLEAMLSAPAGKDKKLQLVQRHEEIARMSKQLAVLQDQLPIDLEWEAMRRKDPPADRLRELFTRLEFKSMLSRLGAGASAPSHAAERTDTIHTLAELTARLKTLSAGGTVTAFPVLTGDHPIDMRLAGLALAGGEASLYIPLAVPGADGDLFGTAHGLDPREVLAAVSAAIPATQRVWSMDVKRVAHACAAQGIAAPASWADASVASFLLYPDEGRHRVAEITARMAGRSAPTEEALLGKGAKARPLGEVPPDEVADWAGAQARGLLSVGRGLAGRLADEGLTSLFEEVEQPLIPVLARMEREGVAIDKAYLKDLSSKFDRVLTGLTADIYQMAGTEFNLNSPKQLGEVLFEKMNLPGATRTKIGYATGAEVLGALAPSFPIASKILEYRELSKLMSTYVDALPKLIHPATGRLHTTYNQLGAATGRLSSAHPNLQNIPIRTESGRLIRRAFVPSRAGELFLAADYSQIELRVLAHLSRDERLLEYFREGADIHTMTSAEIFGVTPDNVTRDMRRKAKEVNFGIIYGITAQGLAMRLGIGRKEAEVYIANYLNRFQGVKAYIEEEYRKAEERGYVTTLLGRRRLVPDILSQNRPVRAAAQRVAINAPIQGTAADIMKVAMVRLDAALGAQVPGSAKTGEPARLILQVHDELILEVPLERLKATRDLLAEVMSTAVPLAVRLDVETKAGPNWADLDPL